MKETNLYYRRRYAGPTGHQQSILKRRRAPASGKRFAEPGCKPLKRNICCPVALLSRLSAVDREQFEDFFFFSSPDDDDDGDDGFLTLGDKRQTFWNIPRRVPLSLVATTAHDWTGLCLFIYIWLCLMLNI